MSTTKTKMPGCLRDVVAAAKRNPYECFASAAVALAFHNPPATTPQNGDEDA